MGRGSKRKVPQDLNFTDIIRQHIRLLPVELAREKELIKLFDAAVIYTNKTSAERKQNRQDKAKWLAQLDARTKARDEATYSGMDEAVAAVWNNRNLGAYATAVEETG